MTQRAQEKSQRFLPVLSTFQVLAIAIAAISPTTSVFLVYGSGLASAGTGVFWAFIIGSCIAISMAFCYAELGSLYPRTGGAYTIVHEVLGGGAGFVAALLFLVLGLVSTASILVSAATYLHALLPILPINIVAVVMMLLITILSLERIKAASWVAATMLIIELVVILACTIAMFISAHHPLSFILNPTMLDQQGNFISIGFSGLLLAVVPALFALNGYDWPLYFAEETKDPRRTLPRAVIIAALISIVVEVLAVLAATLAIPNFQSVLSSSSPLADITRAAAGPVLSTILLIGVIIAMFDTGLSANLGYARIYLDTGRTKSWPEPINRFFGSRNHHGVPKWGFIFLFVGNAILCYFTSLNALVTFTGVCIVTIYLLIAVSAIVSRIRNRSVERPFRMPLWPFPPIIAIIGVFVALTQQATSDIIITTVLVLIALVYWFAYLRLKTDSTSRLIVSQSEVHQQEASNQEITQ
jgi:amino acid transporter